MPPRGGKKRRKTVVIDRYGYLGGTMLNGAGPLHSLTCIRISRRGKTQVVKDPQEIIDRMIEAGGSFGHVEQEKAILTIQRLLL